MTCTFAVSGLAFGVLAYIFTNQLPFKLGAQIRLRHQANSQVSELQDR